MKIDDLVRISLRQVLRQRRRNLGVALAIALGTAGFIIVITMSQDVITNLNDDLELLGGATRIKVYFAGQWDDPEITRQEWFRPHTIEALRQMPRVYGLTIMVEKNGFATISTEDHIYRTRLVGVDDNFWEINSFTPVSGSFFSKKEVTGRNKVVVLGERMAEKLFGTTDVAGELLPIDQDIFKVVGVLGGLGIQDRTEWAFIPLTTLQDRTPGSTVPRRLYIRCKTWDDVDPVVKMVPEIVRAEQPDEGLTIEVAWEQLKHVKRIFWWVQLFVYISIAATLVLGGFGIWNVQMIAVRARTREIGLKKAMGAEDKDILFQFLTEALCLSILSAGMGIILGRAGVEVSSWLLSSSPPEDLFLICVILGLGFCHPVGHGRRAVSFGSGQPHGSGHGGSL